MPYYSVKTTASYEQSVVEMIVDKGGEEIHAGMAPENMTAYVLIESDSIEAIERTIKNVPNAYKVLPGEAASTEVLEFLEPPSDVENVAEGDIAEITDGPYKGEKAKVTKINQGKGRVTVKLIEATVPIPVEMKGSKVRRLDSDER